MPTVPPGSVAGAIWRVTGLVEEVDPPPPVAELDTWPPPRPELDTWPPSVAELDVWLGLPWELTCGVASELPVLTE
jgi:hypothetical protein